MKLDTLLEIKQENKRFLLRLEAAIGRAKDPGIYGHVKNCSNTKEAAALKRAAADMKQILSNLNDPYK